MTVTELYKVTPCQADQKITRREKLFFHIHKLFVDEARFNPNIPM